MNNSWLAVIGLIAVVASGVWLVFGVNSSTNDALDKASANQPISRDVVRSTEDEQETSESPQKQPIPIEYLGIENENLNEADYDRKYANQTPQIDENADYGEILNYPENNYPEASDIIDTFDEFTEKPDGYDEALENALFAEDFDKEFCANQEIKKWCDGYNTFEVSPMDGVYIQQNSRIFLAFDDGQVSTCQYSGNSDEPVYQASGAADDTGSVTLQSLSSSSTRAGGNTLKLFAISSKGPLEINTLVAAYLKYDTPQTTQTLTLSDELTVQEVIECN